MKPWILVSGVLAATSAQAQDNALRRLATWPAAEGRVRVAVAVLGTYHMSNPGQDIGNIRSDDVKTPERQREIEALVDRLAAFAPTKIAIEEPFAEFEDANARYRRYAASGDADLLSRGEDEQIGFRLAAQLGHDTIYPIDVHLDMTSVGFQELLQADPEFGGEFGRFMQQLPQLMDTLSTVLEHSSVTDFLSLMNEDWSVAANHALYLEFLRFGRDDNTGGAETVANWYERNLRILHYLTRFSDFSDPDERILVIFGQGHVKLLRDWVEQADYYRLVDIRPYLRGEVR